MKLIIVSGLSGSGKSIALNTLEDIGYYCIDSLPLFLMKNFVEALSGRGDSRFARMAIGVDSRYRAGELDEFESLLAGLEQQGISSQTLFLEADDETLIKRYSETRRRHPLSDNQRPLAEAIHLERDTLAPLLDKADLRIDTSHTNQHQLRDLIKFRIDKDSPSQVSLLFESFGFKRGYPETPISCTTHAVSPTPTGRNPCGR